MGYGMLTRFGCSYVFKIDTAANIIGPFQSTSDNSICITLLKTCKILTRFIFCNKPSFSFNFSQALCAIQFPSFACIITRVSLSLLLRCELSAFYLFSLSFLFPRHHFIQQRLKHSMKVRSGMIFCLIFNILQSK